MEKKKDTSGDRLVQPLAQSRLLRTTSSWVLNIPKNGVTTTRNDSCTAVVWFSRYYIQGIQAKV